MRILFAHDQADIGIDPFPSGVFEIVEIVLGFVYNCIRDEEDTKLEGGRVGIFNLHANLSLIPYTQRIGL